ncbi:MAG: hypothetical protein FWF85_03090 [Clostridiales bacterium]|nr:hypothetical protein [Clostridiales bacterium]
MTRGRGISNFTLSSSRHFWLEPESSGCKQGIPDQVRDDVRTDFVEI